MDWKTLKGAKTRLASEEGTVFKDWGGRTSVALIYPNSYFLGMSSLGFQTLYGLLNRYDQIVCERVFWEGHEPCSLESQRPLVDFDIIAFSFSYEQDYFNATKLLKSSGIPVLSADRDQRHPLVIAGGAAVTANPEPMSMIIDCLAIGEGEAILPHLVSVLPDGIELPRHELLDQLANLPGIYVPGFSNTRVVRQWVQNLNDFSTVTEIMTSDTELGDMHLMEISRGCARGCRFCLSGYHFRPVRHRGADDLVRQAERGWQHGKRIGLVSAAISDYPRVDELATELRLREIPYSVSSVRIKPLSEELLKGLAESGTKTLTLAPEAGSQRLRRVISKGINEDDILAALRKVVAYEFKQVKLYFMIGLPTETDDDIVAIVQLARECKRIVDRQHTGTQLTLNVTPFVPKAGTPFQWLPMARASTLKKRLALLRKELRKLGIDVKSDSIAWSLVQGMLARGDSNLGYVIADTLKLTLANWHRGLQAVGIAPDLMHQSVPYEEKMPWEIVDSGTDYTILRNEMERALKSGT